MHVIGTAGHVDHGKSTLVAALTGIHPDRLKEEIEREMTIDLGFSWLTLPGGEEIGIVDVPGHRDFIDNMLAGVGGIDAALLVIAADEGIMPQTREHLAILDLLQIHAGMVVLTKIDLVDDPDWLDLVEMDIRKELKDTVLQNAPIQRVSSVTHSGFPELMKGLGSILKNMPARSDLGKPRLPVDRIFSIPGFGTVVTGTLSDGNLVTGDEVEIQPSGIRSRIRGLQTHKKKEDKAVPGSRTAVNISGVDVEQIQRGDLVIHPGQYQTSQRLDLHFRMLPGVSSPLKHRTEVKFYIGTSETLADVRLLGSESLNPGESGWLQLELRAPVVSVRGDRYILRRPSPPETIGGGTVVDPHPRGRHKRFDKEVLQSLFSMSQGSPAEVLLQASLALGLVPVKEVFKRARLESPGADSALQEVIDKGLCIKLDDLLISATHLSTLKDNAETTLSAYHQAYPLRKGMPREELRSRLKLAPHLFNPILHKMVTDGILNESPNWVSLIGHQVNFSPTQRTKVNHLLSIFAATPNTPPSVKKCLAEVGEDIFIALRESGELVTLSEDIVFNKTEYKNMVEKIHTTLKLQDHISLAEVRDILKTTRKYAQPLLEHLDEIGMTVREGDFRRLKR